MFTAAAAAAAAAAAERDHTVSDAPHTGQLHLLYKLPSSQSEREDLTTASKGWGGGVLGRERGARQGLGTDKGRLFAAAQMQHFASRILPGCNARHQAFSSWTDVAI